MPDDNHHTDDHKRSTPAETNRRESGKITTRHRPPKNRGPDARSRPLSSSQTTGPRPHDDHREHRRARRAGRAARHTAAAREPKSTSHATHPRERPHGAIQATIRSAASSDARPPTPKGRRHRRAMMKRKLHRKEVIQPHLPVRLPCYDLVPITSLTLDGSPHKGQATGFGCCRLS